MSFSASALSRRIRRQRAIERARSVTSPSPDWPPISASPRRGASVDEARRHRWWQARGSLNTNERAQLVRLGRELRTAQMEVEILRRTAAHFAEGPLIWFIWWAWNLVGNLVGLT